MARSKASIAPRKSLEATRSLPTIKWGFFCSSAFVSLTLSHPLNARTRQASGRHNNNLKNMWWKLNKATCVRNDGLDKNIFLNSCSGRVVQLASRPLLGNVNCRRRRFYGRRFHGCALRLGGREWVEKRLRGGFPRQSGGGHSQINPADDYMENRQSKKADQINYPETIADDPEAQQRRTGHQSSPGQPPTACQRDL